MVVLSVESNIFPVPMSFTRKPSLDPLLPTRATVSCSSPWAARAPPSQGLAPQMVIPELALQIFIPVLSYYLMEHLDELKYIEMYCAIFPLHGMHTAKRQHRKEKGRWLCHVLQNLYLKTINRSTLAFVFHSVVVKQDMIWILWQVLHAWLEKGSHWASWREFLCYSGPHQSNSEFRKGGPASWLLVDTRRAMRGRGATDWTQNTHNTGIWSRRTRESCMTACSLEDWYDHHQIFDSCFHDLKQTSNF